MRERPREALLGGASLVAGMIAFWAAAFSPISSDVFSLDPVLSDQLAIAAGRPTEWLITNLGFFLGAALTLLGLVVVARLIADRRVRRVASTGVVLGVLGVIAWAVGLYYRQTIPTAAAVASGEVPALFEAAMGGWLYALFAVLSLLSIGLVGAGLFISGSMRRLGAFAVFVSLLELAVFVAFGDIPPFAFYVATAPIGVALILAARRSERSDPNSEGRGAARGGT